MPHSCCSEGAPFVEDASTRTLMPLGSPASIVGQRRAPDVPDGAQVHALGWHLDDLSDFRFFLVVRGGPAVLKNSKQIVTLPGHRPILVSSKQAKKYLESATKQLWAQWSVLFREPIPIDVQVNAAIRVYLPTHRRTDLSNQYEGPQDAMVDAGVLTDDFQIASHDGSRRLYDKENPRVEITLTPYRCDPDEVYLPGLAIEEKTDA